MGMKGRFTVDEKTLLRCSIHAWRIVQVGVPVRSGVDCFHSFGHIGMFQNTPIPEKSLYLNDSFNTDRRKVYFIS